MKRYLLDTTALIDFSKNREPAISRIFKMIDEEEEIGICAITVSEFYAGIPFDKHSVWDEFFDGLSYWNITVSAAKRAGEDRYTFARKGKAISTMDALIAAVARENDAVIVTNNVKDYPMEDIALLTLVD